MKNLDKYCSNFVKNLDYDKITRNEIKIQIKDHINSLKEEYLQKGQTEEEALNSSIKCFNDDRIIEDSFCVKWTLKNVARYSIYIIFIAFLFIILMHTMSPMTVDAQDVAASRLNGGYLRTLKIIPLSTISYMSKYSVLDPAWLTILLFIPFGIFAPFILGKYRNIQYIIKRLLLFIILMQVLKIIFPLGVVSVDMAILQFFGCIIGYAIYKFIIFKFFCKIGLLYKNA